MLYQSHLHTDSETFVRHKKIRIRFDFLCFRIRSMHLDRKGWGYEKTEKRTWKFRTRVQWPLDFCSPLFALKATAAFLKVQCKQETGLTKKSVVQLTQVKLWWKTKAVSMEVKDKHPLCCLRMKSLSPSVCPFNQLQKSLTLSPS